MVAAETDVKMELYFSSIWAIAARTETRYMITPITEARAIMMRRITTEELRIVYGRRCFQNGVKGSYLIIKIQLMIGNYRTSEEGSYILVIKLSFFFSAFVSLAKYSGRGYSSKVSQLDRSHR